MMIGPRHPTTPCPWCQGTGEDHVQRWQAWDPATQRYVERQRLIACDGCRGTGAVTRRAAAHMRQEDTP
jgi:hypothetical protein